MTSINFNRKIVATILVVVCAWISVNGSVLPSFITPCNRSSPSAFNKCLLSTANAVAKVFSKGIPELGVKPLDPVNLKKISIDAPGLKILFDNVVLTGLSTGKFNDYKINFEKGKAVLDVVANLTMKGHYKVDGRVLILPVQGDGPFTVTMRNMNLHVKYAINKVLGEDGKEHWHTVVTKRTFKLERAQFDFKNLFNGNQFLAEPTMVFVNENWEIIMNDIAPAAVDQIIAACFRVTNSFYAKVPVEDLLGPE